MPRRYFDYIPAYEQLNKISTVGSWLIGIGFLIGLISIIQALRDSINCYSTLSQAERVYALLASYVVSINLKIPIFVTVARQSSSRSIGMALLYWWRGI